MSHLIRTIVVGVASLDDQDPWTGHGDPDPVLAPAVRLAAEVGAELHVVHAFEVPAEMAMASSREAVEASSAAEVSLAAGWGRSARRGASWNYTAARPVGEEPLARYSPNRRGR